jgi:CRISPR type I-E-associated protein CasA/Cse1
MDLKKDMDSVLLHPSIVLPLLLYCYISARSGLDGDAGINGGATPYNLFINGDTIYHTILLNVIDSAYVENNLTHFGKMAKPSAGWLKDFEKNPVPGDLRIQDILLWKSRKITLIPISMDEAVCVITGKKINHYAIQKISYTKQRFSIIGFQQDIFSGVINDLKDKKKPWKKVKPNGNLPNWRDYSALILNDNAQDQNKKRTAPVVINRLINYNSKYKTNLNLLGIGTNKAKVLQSSENIFVFSNRFSLEEKYQTIISKIILLTRNFDSSIQFALVIALNLTEKIKTKMGKKIRENIQNTFQSAYWHELGSAFEESLAKLAESDKEPDEVLREWKIILAGHVRKTFARHTEKLIANPKHLKHYEAARSYLESRIHKELLPRKTKEASINKGEKNANAIP